MLSSLSSLEALAESLEYVSTGVVEAAFDRPRTRNARPYVVDGNPHQPVNFSSH